MSKPQLKTSITHRLNHSRATPLHLPESESETSVDNSFLNETTFNSDINCIVRYEIEKKFRHSSTNKHYKFPRISQDTDSRMNLQPIHQYRLNKSRPTSKSKGIDKSLPYIIKSNSSYYDILNSKPNLKNQPKFSKLESGYGNLDYNQLPKTKRLQKICTTTRNTPSPAKPRHVRWKSDALVSSKVKFSPYIPYTNKNASQAVQSIV